MSYFLNFHSDRILAVGQKMWVRKDDNGWWVAGCQCCGCLVYEDPAWSRALAGALYHANVRHSWRFL